MYKIIFFMSLITKNEAFSADQINWWRPKVKQTHPGIYEGFANTPEDFNRIRRRVYFDACHIKAGCSSMKSLAQVWLKNRWQIMPDFEKDTLVRSPIHEEHNNDCLWEWQAPREGDYTVHLNMQDDFNHSVGEVATKFFVKDMWIVAMGDSYPSGQGNPDLEARFFGILPSKWIDPGCFRSARSFPYMTYEKVLSKYPAYGLAFSFLACSGASIVNGLLDCFTHYLPQLRVLDRLLNASRADCSYHCQNHYSPQICATCKYGPDAILLGVGGNDIKYGQVAKKMFIGNPYPEFLDMAKRMDELGESMNEMDQSFKSMKIDPKSIFYAEYFDLLRNDQGIIDANCEGTGLATTWEFFLADKTIRQPINDLIGTTCEKCGWTKIDGIDEMFSRHGICSQETYIRNVGESLAIQGNMNGAFHPNAKGHKKIAEVVWRKIEPHLEEKFGKGHKMFTFNMWKGYYRKV